MWPVLIKFIRREDSGDVLDILLQVAIQENLSRSEVERLIELFDDTNRKPWGRTEWFAVYNYLAPYITTGYM